MPAANKVKPGDSGLKAGLAKGKDKVKTDPNCKDWEKRHVGKKSANERRAGSHYYLPATCA
jgi:hypothetical protein